MGSSRASGAAARRAVIGCLPRLGIARGNHDCMSSATKEMFRPYRGFGQQKCLHQQSWNPRSLHDVRSARVYRERSTTLPVWGVTETHTVCTCCCSHRNTMCLHSFVLPRTQARLNGRTTCLAFRVVAWCAACGTAPEEALQLLVIPPQPFVCCLKWGCFALDWTRRNVRTSLRSTCVPEAPGVAPFREAPTF